VKKNEDSRSFLKSELFQKLEKLRGQIKRTGDISNSETLRIISQLAIILESENMMKYDPKKAWKKICDNVLSISNQYSVHKLVHCFVFQAEDRNFSSSLFPVYIPDKKTISASNISRTFFLKEKFKSFDEIHEFSIKHPKIFWSRILKELGIFFRNSPEMILSNTNKSAEHAKWLYGAKLNIVESCFENRDSDGLAIIASDKNGQMRKLNRGELKEKVVNVAKSLYAMGFKPGDSIGIYMIMNLESVIAYLGIVISGCKVISIADSFASQVIEQRMRIAKGKAIFTQGVVQRGNKQINLFAKVAQATEFPAIVVPSFLDNKKDKVLGVSLRRQDIVWQEFMELGNTSETSEQFEAFITSIDTTTNILFSSGTTGDPKAIPWTHLTPIKAAADGWAHHDIREKDIVAWPTNLGWMMGPWLIYAALLNGASIALYEDAPTGKDFLKFVETAGVTMLGVVPSLVKNWRLNNSFDEIDLSKIRVFSSTGEASNYDDMFWLMSKSNYKPIIEYCGGTEIGGAFVTSTVIQPQIPAHFTSKALGSDFILIDHAAQECTTGELVLLPPIFGTSDRLLNRDHHETYFSNMPKGPKGQLLRRHGDVFQSINNGCFFRAHGRSDDTMNLGGIKTSSSAIETCVNRVNCVLETAAVGIPPQTQGPDHLVIFTVLHKDHSENVTPELKKELKKSMQKMINQYENPLFKIYEIIIIPKLVRTASGKVLRRALRDEFIEENSQGDKL
jgi:acetyl-CoA synthetase